MILASGIELLVPGVRSFEGVLAELLDSATDLVQIAMYRMDPRGNFFELLGRTAARGVRVTVIVNHAEGQTAARDLLCELVRTSPNFRALSFQRDGGIMHAKVVIVDRQRMAIGSANIGFGGLHGNYELGVLVEGEDAWTASTVLDRLAILSERLRCLEHRQSGTPP
jgi:cardiolipin synthase